MLRLPKEIESETKSDPMAMDELKMDNPVECRLFLTNGLSDRLIPWEDEIARLEIGNAWLCELLDIDGIAMEKAGVPPAIMQVEPI